MNSIPLNPDVIQQIGSYLNPRQAVAFTQVNKSIRANCDELLRQQFRETFGKINPAYQRDRTVMARLLSCVEKNPNALYLSSRISRVIKPPSRGFERLKWLLGIENSYDKEIQECYNRNVRLLENTSATSIIQLNQQMIAYWHTYRLIEARLIRRSLEIDRLSLIVRIFLVCLGNFLKFFCKTSCIKEGITKEGISASYVNKKNLLEKSYASFTKIGGFQSYYGEDYDVVALCPMNESSPVSMSRLARVGIIRSAVVDICSCPLKVFFDVQIESEEEHIGKHHLKINTPVPIRSLLINAPLIGSQKILQIMWEIGMQNKVTSLQIGSTYFPSSTDILRNDQLSEIFESWHDVIRREPILEPGAAILPKY